MERCVRNFQPARAPRNLCECHTKNTTPIAKADARSLVAAYAVWCTDVSAQDVSAAFRIEDESKIGFWDALILASAARSGAVRLLSEDLNDGQTIDDIRVENPFARC